MRKLLEAFENAISYLVRVFFLVGTLSGTAFFFLHNVLPTQWLPIMEDVSGAAFALAVEGFAYSQQTRLNAAWTDFTRAQPETPARERAQKHLLTAAVGMLLVLVMSMITSGAFWFFLMQPQSVFSWFEWGVLSLFIPVIYVVSGFAVRVHLNAAEVLTSTADEMLLKTTHATAKQWKSRVRSAKRQGIDLAPIAVTLLEDAGEVDSAKRIRTIANGLTKTDGVKGGVKSADLYSSPARKSSAATGDALYYQNEPPKKPGSRRSKRGSKVTAFERRRKVRVAVKKTPEELVFDYLSEHPEATLTEIEDNTKVSHPTAVRLRKKWLGMDHSAVAEG